MQPKAFSYIRMSTEKQLKGDSLRRQKEASEKYALAHGLNLIKSLEDIGVSAFKGRNRTHGILKNFIELVKENKIPNGSYLLIENLDRLSRDKVLNALSLLLELISAGIKVVTLQDSQIYDEKVNAYQLIISLTIMARAHEESATKSKRVKEAWKKKRANMHKRPITSICPGWMCLNKDTEKFELIPERVAVVKRIFEETLSGMGRTTIARGLNKGKIPTFSNRGTVWYGGTIQKIRHNVAVMGYLPLSGTQKVCLPVDESTYGYYPQIISKEVFYKAQALIKARRSSRGRRGVYFANLFQGCVFCAECGSTMTIRSNGRTNGYSYLCGSFHRGNGCDNNTRHNVDKLERVFFRGRFDIDYDAIDSEKPIEHLEAKKYELEIKREELRGAWKKWVDFIEKSNSDLSAVSERIIELNDKILKVEQELERVTEEYTLTKHNQDSLEDRMRIIKNLADRLKKAGGDEKFRIRSAINQQMRLADLKFNFYRNKSVRLRLSENESMLFYPYKNKNYPLDVYLYE